jgi:cytoskeleton protein RodZ
MAATLGEKLREAREARGYALREVADQTRISVRYLESIENDDYSALPGGVFNKGFVKAFARYVGIDEKEALDDYARLMGQQGTVSPEDDLPISRRSEVYIGDEPRSPILTIIVSLVMLGLLVWGVIAGLQWYQNRGVQTDADPTPTPVANSNIAATPTPTPVVSVESGLNLQLKAGNEDISVSATADGRKQDIYLKAGDTRDLKAQNEIRLIYSKSRAGSLQMTINGQPAKVQTQSPKNAVEMIINRETVAQFIQ